VSFDAARVADILEIHDLCSRYMAYASQYLVDRWMELFTPDGEYKAFGVTYPVDKLPELLAAAPRGQFIGNAPIIEFDGDDRATGIQHYVFIDQKTHDMRLAWYVDEYRRLEGGWRLHHRSTTFLRKSGGFDSGRPHDPLKGPGEQDLPG